MKDPLSVFVVNYNVVYIIFYFRLLFLILLFVLLSLVVFKGRLGMVEVGNGQETLHCHILSTLILLLNSQKKI